VSKKKIGEKNEWMEEGIENAAMLEFQIGTE
jgi:hypothetical protein